MSDKVQISIQRIGEVLRQTGLSRSTFYLRIKEGLLPPPISLGGRAVGWLEHEINAVLKALIARKDPEEIRQVVNSLVVARETLS